MFRQKGAIDLLILLAVTIIAAAIPAATKLVQERQEMRKLASLDVPCKVCQQETGECKIIASPPNCSHSFNECTSRSQCPQPTNPPNQPTTTPKPEPTTPPAGPTKPPKPTNTPQPTPTLISCPSGCDDYLENKWCKLECQSPSTCQGDHSRCCCPPPATPTPRLTNTSLPTNTPFPTPIDHQCFTPDDCQGANRCNLSCSGWPRKCFWTPCPIPRPGDDQPLAETATLTPTPTLSLPLAVSSSAGTVESVISTTGIYGGVTVPYGVGSQPMGPLEVDYYLNQELTSLVEAAAFIEGAAAIGTTVMAAPYLYAYGTAALATAPAWVAPASAAVTLGSTAYTAYQCGQGNIDACITGMAGGQMWTEQQLVQAWGKAAAESQAYWERIYEESVQAVESTGVRVYRIPVKEMGSRLGSEYPSSLEFLHQFTAPAGLAYPGEIYIRESLSPRGATGWLAHEYGHQLYYPFAGNEYVESEILAFALQSQGPYGLESSWAGMRVAIFETGLKLGINSEKLMMMYMKGLF